MRATAKIKLAGLRKKHQMKDSGGLDIPDSFDGETMWKDLVAGLTVVESDVDAKKHQKEFERMRDTPLADNCSVQQWQERIVSLTWANDHTEVPVAGERLSKIFLDMMPKALSSDKRDGRRGQARRSDRQGDRGGL